MAGSVSSQRAVPSGRTFEIAAVIDGPSDDAMRVVAGLGAFARAEYGGRWHLDVLVRDSAGDRRDPLAGWTGDGAIVIGTGVWRKSAHVRAAIPLVFVGVDEAYSERPLVYSDDRAAVRMAADHLAEAGFARIAFCGSRGRGTASLAEELAPRADSRRSRIIAFEHPAPGSPAKARQQLGDWLARLPKPIGIVAVSSVVASELVAVCHRRGIDVPNQVAIVGIGIDESLCDATQPQLTRVVRNLEAMGKQAATMLARGLASGSCTGDRIAVPPRGLVIRGSSDTTAVADPLLREALRLIRRRACEERLTSEDVADALGISRRSLDRLSARHLGRSIRDEIHRCRLAEARLLLLTTDQKLLTVAIRTGFANAAHLCTAFKAAFGVTPGQFRRDSASL